MECSRVAPSGCQSLFFENEDGLGLGALSADRAGGLLTWGIRHSGLPLRCWKGPRLNWSTSHALVSTSVTMFSKRLPAAGFKGPSALTELARISRPGNKRRLFEIEAIVSKIIFYEERSVWNVALVTEVFTSADCGSGAADVTMKTPRLISAAIRWLECDQHNGRNLITAPTSTPPPPSCRCAFIFTRFNLYDSGLHQLTTDSPVHLQTNLI